MTTPLTGDIKDRVEVTKRGVTLHNFPTVLKTELAAIANIVNDKAQSGKRLGAQIMGVDDLDAPTVAALYVASGNDDDSVWILSVDVLGTSADITPV